MTALTSDLNYASLFYIVVIVHAGIFCSESVVFRCIRQLCGILAVLFGYLDVVVTGDSELALGRDIGNRQLNRAAAGKGGRGCGDLDRGCSLIDSQSKLVRRSAIICVTSKIYRNFRGACTDDSNRHGSIVILNSSNGRIGACHSGCFICCIGKGKRLIAIGSGGLVVGDRDAARLACYGNRNDRSGCRSGIRTILNRYNAVIKVVPVVEMLGEYVALVALGISVPPLLLLLVLLYH